MYLKKITSCGFKSFADRITITLEKHHISGIVGPNGSGKSNVIDAVRWVMGEQNAKMLRGEKATDIIFAGSERRKPLGMAEVTLVFDNSEGSPFCPPEYRHEPEVALTRRLYIDGEREYLINRKPCRLKDITSFFTSTGLGGRSYSMIQQGQVDRILQAKPEQIREILEEAAGTLVFKRRRQEAFKKLEATRVNLSRIDDILTEVGRQIQALQTQVEKAERFQALSTELRTKEIVLFTHNYLHFQEKQQDLKNTIDTASAKEIASSTDITHHEERYEALKEQMAEADPELHALTEEITVLREKIASSEASLASAMQLLENGQGQLNALSNELAEDEKHYAATLAKLAEAEASVVAAEEEAERLAELMDEYQHRLSLAEEETLVFTGKIEGLDDERRNIERILDSNKVKRESLERDYSKASRQKAEHSERLLSLEEEYSQGQIMVEGAQIKVKNGQKGLDAELDEKNRLELRLAERRERLSELKAKIDQQREQYLESKARLASLEELELTSSDTGSIVRELNVALAPHGAAAHCLLLTEVLAFAPTFHDLPEKTARAFEHWAERLLIKDWQHLQLVATAMGGLGSGGVPATLLDTTTREGSSRLASWAESFPLQPLASALSIERPYPGLEELLAGLYLLSDDAAVDRVLHDLPGGVVIFTSSGHSYGGRHELILGVPSGQGALSRKLQIEELREATAQGHERLSQSQEKLTRLSAQDEKDATDLKEIDRTIFTKNKQVLQLMSDLQAIDHKMEMKREQIIEARQHYNRLDEQCEAFGTELDDLRHSDHALSEEKAQTLAAYEDAKTQAEELRDERAEVQRQFDQKKIEIATARTRAQTLREHFDQDHAQLAGIEARLKRRREEKETLTERYAQAQNKQQQLEADIETYIYQREELEEQLTTKREANAELLEELRVIESRLKETRELMRLAQKAISDKELELERIRIGMTTVKEQALEKYHIDLDSYEFERQEQFDPANQARVVGSLRSRLEGLGPVNVMAIDEYRELKERQTFIQAQKDEVVSSVELLELAIDEIEETSKTKFLDTFHTLNKEFMELFPILFPRGEGHIALTDEGNPLEAGVEILVRLPGKSQQNMRLFSGGEKALTAIALIFALLKSKPTPFCFLDEVDAPLDETNVSRYNKVLEALADRFQFIVITHRRRTMEVLDTLYGVTMQEPGVSKVVGVDLTKALPTHLQKAFSDGNKDKEEGKKDAPPAASPAPRKGASAHP